jgi:hypothetical protein
VWEGGWGYQRASGGVRGTPEVREGGCGCGKEAGDVRARLEA